MLLGFMGRPIELQGWSSNEAARGSGMFELKVGAPIIRV